MEPHSLVAMSSSPSCCQVTRIRPFTKFSTATTRGVSSLFLNDFSKLLKQQKDHHKMLASQSFRLRPCARSGRSYDSFGDYESGSEVYEAEFVPVEPPSNSPAYDSDREEAGSSPQYGSRSGFGSSPNQVYGNLPKNSPAYDSDREEAASAPQYGSRSGFRSSPNQVYGNPPASSSPYQGYGNGPNQAYGRGSPAYGAGQSAPNRNYDTGYGNPNQPYAAFNQGNNTRMNSPNPGYNAGVASPNQGYGPVQNMNPNMNQSYPGVGAPSQGYVPAPNNNINPNYTQLPNQSYGAAPIPNPGYGSPQPAYAAGPNPAYGNTGPGTRNPGFANPGYWNPNPNVSYPGSSGVPAPNVAGTSGVPAPYVSYPGSSGVPAPNVAGTSGVPAPYIGGINAQNPPPGYGPSPPAYGNASHYQDQSSNIRSSNAVGQNAVVPNPSYGPGPNTVPTYANPGTPSYNNPYYGANPNNTFHSHGGPNPGSYTAPGQFPPPYNQPPTLQGYGGGYDQAQQNVSQFQGVQPQEPRETFSEIVKKYGKEQPVMLKFIWLEKRLGLALDNVIPNFGSFPLTPYYFFPDNDALDELKNAIEQQKWISESRCSALLKQAEELVGLWQKTNAVSA